jgi:hypothetical protein
LPSACGYDPFKIDGNVNNKTAQEFVTELRDVMDELKFAYSHLTDRIKSKICKEFECSLPFAQARGLIANRCEKIAIHIKESKLKAFCLRLLDGNLQESEWVESIGSFVIPTPPSRWRDIDEEQFSQEIERLIVNFIRVESIFFSKIPAGAVAGIRLSITKSDGSEREQVFHFTSEEQTMLNQLKSEIRQILHKNKRLGLIATSEAVWKELEKKEFN